MVGTLFQGNRVHLSEVREFVWPNLDVLNNLEKKFYDFTIKKKKHAVFKIQQMVTLAWLREKIFDYMIVSPGKLRETTFESNYSF